MPAGAMPARKGSLHTIAMLQPVPLKCVLKLQRINRTTVVVARIPNFAVYITDGGQEWTATVCHIVQYNDHLKCSTGEIRNVRKRQPFSPLPHSAHDVTGVNKFGPWNRGGQN